MDYGPNFFWQFTPDQIARMREVVNYAPFRAKLVNSQARTAPGLENDEDIFVPRLVIPDETGMLPKRRGKHIGRRQTYKVFKTL